MRTKRICTVILAFLVLLMVNINAFAIQTGNIIYLEEKTIHELSNQDNIKVFIQDLKNGLDATKLYRAEENNKFVNLKEERDAERAAVMTHLIQNKVTLNAASILNEFKKNGVAIQQKIDAAKNNVPRITIDTTLYINAVGKDDVFRVIDIY